MNAKRSNLDIDLTTAIADSKTQRHRQVEDICSKANKPVPTADWVSIDPDLQHQLLSAGSKHYVQHTLDDIFTFPPLGNDGRPDHN